MAQNEWENLGREIQEIVNDAVSENNYASLNDTINKVLSSAIDSGSDALKSVIEGALGGNSGRRRSSGSSPFANPEHNARAYETHRNHGYQVPPFGAGQSAAAGGAKKLYVSMNTPMLKGGIMTMVGGAFAVEALGSLAATLLAFLFHGGVFSLFGLAGTIILGGIGGWLLGKGISVLGKVKRFRIYQKVLGKKAYAELKKLAAETGKPLPFTEKDVREMIREGWFIQGHIDEENTTLMAADEIWEQYLKTHEDLVRQRAQAQREEQEKARKAEHSRAEEKLSAEVQDVLDRGSGYLEELRRCNDAIPGEEISDKISRIEVLVNRIFERVREHPEVIPDLKKMMNYYLPTTVKLLKAYQELDAQPVQGENISKSKQEIEQTLDTLNTAYEILLDSIFQDTAWDISSDITVLNTMLAQEGLTGGFGAGGAAAAAAESEKDEKKINLTL